MINTVDQLIEILDEINCNNREVAFFDSSDKKQHAFAILVKSDSEAFNLWKKFRSVIDKTEMWPVLYTSYCAYIPDLREPLTKDLMCKILQNECFFNGKIYTDAFIKKALEQADRDNPFYDVLEKPYVSE